MPGDARIPNLNADPHETLPTYATAETPGDLPGPETLPLLSLGRAADSREGPEADSAARESYVLLARVGQGGMGVVYQALQSSLGRFVAIKKSRDDGEAADASEVRMRYREFQQEAVITARLEHPNIVPVHDFGRDGDGSAILCMKLVQGATWSKVLSEDFAAMAVEDFLAKHIPILVDVSQAVAFAHSRGVIHRDLKPSQVMLGEFGEVLLLDWGLAVLLDDAGTSRKEAVFPQAPAPLPTVATATNPSGTPSYMAPEQTLDDPRKLGTWTDVYLLGGVLYNLLTGSAPHAAPNSEAALRLARAGVIVPPSERAPGRSMPPDLEKLAMRALQPGPDDRVPGALEFLTGLKDHLSGAGERREAKGIAEAIAPTLESGPADYDSCEAALSRLRRIETLWPGMPGLAELSARLHGRWAELALAAGDIQLARMQAGQLAVPQDRARLIGMIDAEASRRNRERAQRRYAITGAFCMLCALVGTSVVFSRRVAAERDVARQERRTATSRAASARELSHFMLRDLGKALDPEVERDRLLIASIADEVMAHFRGLDVSGDSASERAMHAESLVATGRELVALGRPGDALELVTSAVGIQRDVDSESHLLLSDYLAFQGECQALAGGIEAAKVSIEQAISEWRLSGAPPSVGYAEALNNRAAIRVGSGDVEGGLSDIMEAVRLRRELLGTADEETIIAELNRIAILGYAGRPREAREAIDELILRAEEAIPRTMTYLELRRLSAVMNAREGNSEDAGRELQIVAEGFIDLKGPTHPRTIRARVDQATNMKKTELASERIRLLAALVADVAHSPDVADSTRRDILAQYAGALRASGQIGLAQEKLAALRTEFESTGGTDSLEYASVLFEYAMVRLEAPDYDPAETRPILERVVAITGKSGGAARNHIPALIRLGINCHQLGEHEAATEVLRKACGAAAQFATGKSNDLLMARAWLADSLLQAGRPDEAAREFGLLPAEVAADAFDRETSATYFRLRERFGSGGE